MKPARVVPIALLLALSLLLPSATGSVRSGAAAAPAETEEAGAALVAVFLDEPARWAQAQEAGLIFYSHQSSSEGDYLLAGAAPAAGGGLPELRFPARVLDVDTAGASYYLIYPPRTKGSIRWGDYGEVLLELADQVLLRTSAAQAERLADAGAEIVKLTLQPQPWPAAGPAAPLAITPDPIVQTMLDDVATSTISQYTGQLSGEQSVTVDGASYTITRRQTYSGTPIQKAGHFVGEHLAALGMGVEYQVWGSSGTPSTYPNVIGQITGLANPNNIYIIGAHLDDYPSSGTAPGADDNASGSVGTLIAADILSQYRWNCTLRFAFWTGEEQGLLGSAAYATRAKNAGENILGYLNMDMIAYNGGAPNNINLFAKSSVAGSVTLRDLYADAITAYGLDLAPVKYLDNSLGDRSDNKSFWDKGYASMLAIEDYNGGDYTPYYHTSGDTLSTLNMAYYTDFVKASLATFVHLNGCLAPDFNVRAAPKTQDVCTGANATHTIAVNSISGFTSPVTLSASVSPAGPTTSFSANPVTPTGSSTLTVGNLATAGAYNITIAGVSGSLTHSSGVTLNVTEPLAAGPTLTAPANGSTAAGTTPTFTWSAVAGATSYTLQASTDPAFGALVINQSGLTATSYTPGSALSYDTVYYWRVAAVNGCGSKVSSIHAFRTEAPSCRTYASTDAPKTISDLTTIYSNLTVPDAFNVTDVNVTIGSIVHTYDADLDIYIEHPDDTAVELSTDNGGSGDNYTNTVFDDEAATAITAGAAPFTGSYRPEGSLTALDGKTSAGAWQLRIYDDASQDTGTLQSWSLTLCGAPAGTTADYSDLASSYGVAWHTGAGAVRLGGTSDWDTDTGFADGTDNTTDTGVARTPFTASSGGVNLTVTGSGTGYVTGWFDWNQDGDFSDTGEQIFTNQAVSAGSTAPVSFSTNGVNVGNKTFNARFRVYSSAQMRGPDAAPQAYGGAANGEVEDYTWTFSPLAVDLASFTAEAAADGVTLAWETVSEIDNAGFNIYRADSSLVVGDDGSSGVDPLRMTDWVRLNETLIPAATPGSAQGNAYTWIDAAPAAGTTWYMLEDVSLDGVATQHEPVSVTVAAPNAVHMTAFGAAVTAGPALGGLAALALAALAGIGLRKRR